MSNTHGVVPTNPSCTHLRFSNINVKELKVEEYCCSFKACWCREKMDTIKNWLLTFTGCIGFVLNLIIVLQFFKKPKRKRKELDLMIVSLALADICFCLGVIIAFTVKLAKVDTSNNYLLIYWNISQGVSFIASLLHIMLISVDRFIGVVYPFLYRGGYITPSQLNVVLVTLWLSSCFITSTQFWLKLVVIDIIVSILISVAFIAATTIYIIIGTTLNRSGENQTGDVNKQTMRKKRNFRRIVLCLLLNFAFFACNMPFVIANIYYDIKGKEWSLKMAYVNYFLLTINCILDPIFYYLQVILTKWVNNLLRIVKQKTTCV